MKLKQVGYLIIIDLILLVNQEVEGTDIHLVKVDLSVLYKAFMRYHLMLHLLGYIVFMVVEIVGYFWILRR